MPRSRVPYSQRVFFGKGSTHIGHQQPDVLLQLLVMSWLHLRKVLEGFH